MKSSILCWRCSLEVKLPRRRSLRTRIENQISIWLIQEACFGVKWKVIRWLLSHRNASRVAIDWRMPDFPFSPRSSLMPQRSATKRVTPLGHVGVEVIADHLPPRRRRRRAEQTVQERHEV